ncbi:PTS sugar transporter subunit IIB [Ligilactobacillus acidipiscis]|uniref:PTS system galactitol-specific enzyme IIB component n=1 Tax=Ligilactobacillus acidipiscis TaxID=89059 RepID=A0A0R2JW67_9LACO|nr:PTS sugar transporter subunit IIB [Ligilactobacillus acidipiscis]KRN81320.1 PTS system galactitol-specific enzyme IIB component [Ligilactobacillus acidipiscis]
MSSQKKVVVACASGVATSQTVASKILDMCDQAGLNVMVEATNISHLASIIDSVDVYVSIVPNSGEKWDIPVVSGIPFLTGDQIEQEFAKLKQALS